MPNKKSKSLNNLFNILQQNYPDLTFCQGTRFKFRPPATVIFGPAEDHAELLALHEVGHAILHHYSFTTNVSRLKMEMAAWEKARELAPRYGVIFDEEVMQRELDSYRDWLHQKSRCPHCGLTRFETSDGVYHCPRCENFGSLSP